MKDKHEVKDKNKNYIRFFKDIGFDENFNVIGNCILCNTKGVLVHYHKCNIGKEKIK